MIKIVSLTSPLPDVSRLSSPRPRLRHGRRPNLTLNIGLKAREKIRSGRKEDMRFEGEGGAGVLH